MASVATDGHAGRWHLTLAGGKNNVYTYIYITIYNNVYIHIYVGS